MHFEIHNFRHANSILARRPEWMELRQVIQGITRDDVIAKQRELGTGGRRAPKGAQRAVNLLFKERLTALAWDAEMRLFDAENTGEGKELAKWAMDFVKRGDAPPESPQGDFGLGVEVTFNHSEAVAWTLIRLDLASEYGVRSEARIDVGVAIYATADFRRWGRMGSAAGTFEQACIWLRVMRPVIPIPLLLVGLKPEDDQGPWAPTSLFPGTSTSR